jgi:hypothetical protein
MHLGRRVGCSSCQVGPAHNKEVYFMAVLSGKLTACSYPILLAHQKLLILYRKMKGIFDGNVIIFFFLPYFTDFR